MENQKDKLISIGVTILFHLLIFLFLFFYYLKPSLDNRYAEELEGVPVMFGNVSDAFGDNEPNGRGNGGNNTSEQSPSSEKTEEITTTKAVKEVSQSVPTSTKTEPATQSLEETIAIKEAKKKADEKKQQEILEKQKQAEENKRKAEAERKAKAETEKKGQISNQMSGLFGNGSGDGSRGNTHGSGTQGVPTGNASYGKTSGIGGWGSFDLGGRSLGSGGLKKPEYSEDDYGTVVVDIIVDAAGNVVEASIGRGTNTPNAKLRTEAVRAAKQTKFNAVNSVANQKGSITYKFNLN